MALKSNPGHPLTGTQTQAIMDWLERVAPTNTANRKPLEAWIEYLKSQVGTSSDVKRRGLEQQWLTQRIVALGGTVSNDYLAPLWDQYLTIKGHTGDVVDKFAQWIDHGTA